MRRRPRLSWVVEYGRRISGLSSGGPATNWTNFVKKLRGFVNSRTEGIVLTYSTVARDGVAADAVKPPPTTAAQTSRRDRFPNIIELQKLGRPGDAYVKASALGGRIVNERLYGTDIPRVELQLAEVIRRACV